MMPWPTNLATNCVVCRGASKKECGCSAFMPCGDAMVEGIRKALRVPGCRVKHVDISKIHFSPTGIQSLSWMLEEMQERPIAQGVDVEYDYNFGVQALTIDSTGTWGHENSKANHCRKYKPKTYSLLSDFAHLDLSRKNLGDEDVALLCKWLELHAKRWQCAQQHRKNEMSQMIRLKTFYFGSDIHAMIRACAHHRLMARAAGLICTVQRWLLDPNFRANTRKYGQNHCD